MHKVFSQRSTLTIYSRGAKQTSLGTGLWLLQFTIFAHYKSVKSHHCDKLMALTALCFVTWHFHCSFSWSIMTSQCTFLSHPPLHSPNILSHTHLSQSVPQRHCSFKCLLRALGTVSLSVMCIRKWCPVRFVTFHPLGRGVVQARCCLLCWGDAWWHTSAPNPNTGPQCSLIIRATSC